MTLGAALIETRQEKLLPAIQEHLRWLPDETALYVWTHPEHFAMIHEHYPRAVCTPFHIHRNYFTDLNHLMTREAFWTTIAEDRVLIFQHDSGIIRRGIESFYEWDYIGAPFGPAQPFVGNGGFSLRNPRAMANICREFHYSPYLPEDTFFPVGCRMLGYRLATVQAAMTFSCEIHYLLGTFGYHAIDRYLTPDQVRTIKTQYATVTIPLRTPESSASLTLPVIY